MNIYYINDEEFMNSSIFKDFMTKNPTRGNLRIRAYAASQAVPIKGLNVVISTLFEDARIIFFEGETNESGVIEKISLPTPLINGDNMVAPNTIEYDINAKYVPDNISAIYKVNMYEDICVQQNINIVPELRISVGDNSGS